MGNPIHVMQIKAAHVMRHDFNHYKILLLPASHCLTRAMQAFHSLRERDLHKQIAGEMEKQGQLQVQSVTLFPKK